MQKGRSFLRPFVFDDSFVLFAVAQEAQQEHEQVDEIKVERQRAHDRRFAKPSLVAILCVFNIVGLNLLGVPSGQASKDQNADDRDREGHRR